MKQEGGRLGPRGVLIVFVCSSAIMMTALDGTILNIALPAVQRNFRAPTSDLQWAVDAYILLRCSILFLSGAMGDRFGRKRQFALGLWIFLLGSLASGLAPSMGALIGFRAFQGFGSAVLTPSSLAMLTASFPDRRRRALAVGIWGALASTAQSAGPLLGGILVQSFGWRSVFLVNVPLGLLSYAGLRRLDESKAAVPRRFDVPGQASIGLGLFALTYALIAGPNFGWADPAVLACFVLAALLWGAFVVIEQRVEAPMLVLAYFRSRSLTGSGVLALFNNITTGSFLFFNTLYLQEVRGYSPLSAGLLSLPVAAVGLVFAPLSGHLTGTRGPRLPATAALVATTAAMGLLSWHLTPTSTVGFLLLAYFVLGIGSGLVNTPITNGAISGMPRDQAGVAGAVATTGRTVGLNLGVAMIGSVIFSIAPQTTLTGGHPGHAMAAGPAALFVHALRVGDFVCTALAGVGVLVALWAYSKRPVGSPESEASVETLPEPQRR